MREILLRNYSKNYHHNFFFFTLWNQLLGGIALGKHTKSSLKYGHRSCGKLFQKCINPMVVCQKNLTFGKAVRVLFYLRH